MLGKKWSLNKDVPKEHDIAPVVPKGLLLHLQLSQIKPSINNPRRLFDPEPLNDLRESIRIHGVLVPITVYKLPGQELYAIVDGERRYKCCSDLHDEGIELDIPANVVGTPEKFAALIYMFNIHNFREPWELMPTALSLKTIVDELNITKNSDLHELTGLSLPQIERCKKILSFPEKFQKLSLDPDPKIRIPSNFWIELHPVLEITPKIIPDLSKSLGRDGITEKMVEKYKAKKIKSVIHFRRILEAIDTTEPADGTDPADVSNRRQTVANRFEEYVLNVDLETRATFDDLILETRKVRKVVEACDNFIKSIELAKVTHSIDNKDEMIIKLTEVIEYCQNLKEKLSGDDAPDPDNERE